MANTVYDNFYLSNEIEDQYKSHLDLQTFCTVDNALEGTAGMLRKINVYKATDGTEKLAMGAGNSKSIEVGFTPREYRIQLAQNRFKYYDEQAMTDPQLVPVGTKHMGTDMFNTVNADIYGEFAKATQVVVVTKLNFDAFADAQSVLALEDLEGVTTLVEVESVPAEVVAGFYFYHAGEFYTTEANLTALAKARAPELASLVFVKMAETEQLDDATLTEHAEQFSEWAYPVAYAVKAICSYKGKLYRCVQAHSSQADWTPPATASLWKEIGDPTAEYPEWSQPLGAHDAYALGDKVAHSGKHWVSTAANNVWEPGVYGWEEVTE